MKKLSTLFVLVSFCAVLALSALTCGGNLSTFSNAKSYVRSLTDATLLASNVLPILQEGVALSD